MRWRRRWWFSLVLLAAAACGGGKEPAARARLRLATTTSTHNSGLLEYLLAPFETREACDVQVLAVGTGQALALGERGDADVVLVHARKRELAYVQAGHGVDRRDVMYNDFVIAGPAADPARIRGSDPLQALRAIAQRRAKFVSRGDDSGTHVRELELWKAARTDGPQTLDGYLSAGQGMGSCLIMADEKRAYILTDRGTYTAFADKLDLVVLVEGGALLRNPYGAMLVNPDRHPHTNAALGRKLLDYLTSKQGRGRIASFRVNKKQLFFPIDNS